MIPPAPSAREESAGPILFPFHQDLLLMSGSEGNLSFVTEAEFARSGYPAGKRYSVSIPGLGKTKIADLGSIPENGALTQKPMRALLTVLPRDETRKAVAALTLLKWFRETRFCPKCRGSLGEPLLDNSRVCGDCGAQLFPSITPAVIVLVHRDGKALLAHNVNFAAGTYSTIAGFVEPGETLEECVAREVREETGIEVSRITYFGSQPWPFPHSLMVGFTAEYAAGQITPDGIEIAEAEWFTPDELPNIPPPGSISRRLIDWFRETYGRHE